jgi:hypothetical protein
MDAIAWLALMSKANEVFGAPDVFLSFPAMTPISYKPENLNVSAAFSNPQVGHTFADLSLNVNSLPTGTLFQATTETYLWKAYSQWLNDMVLAKDQMTDDERSRYDQANALLTIKDSNGFLVDSPMVVSYKQYRDAWFSANQNYLNEKSTAEASSDSTIQGEWKNVDEPRLRALVDQAMSDWQNKGYKADVENAQALKARLESQSPSTVWNTWRGALIPDIDLPTDPVSNMQYAPTLFSPADLFNGDWPTFKLSSDEIKEMVSTAPTELRSIFSSGDGTSTITSLSFEFRSAALVRPWLNTDVFKTRFWKFGRATPPLSDGAAPPQGTWPAYVSAVVFARNIQVTSQTAPQPLHLQALAVSQAILQPGAITAVVRDHRTEATSPGAATVRDHSTAPAAANPSPRIAFFSGAIANRRMIAAAPAPQTEPALAFTRLATATYRLPIAISQPIIWDPAPQPPPSQPATDTSDGDVSVLAFICRRLPQTPNPDPSLNWES